MKKEFVLLIVLVISMGIGLIVSAQDDCGDGLPCGKLPWDLPDLPVMNSPTPIPTIAIEPTQDSGYVITPTCSFGECLEDLGWDDQIATLNAIAQGTSPAINDMQGTPVNLDESFNQLGSNAGLFFGYVRGISTESFGKFSILVNFMFLTLVVVISTKVLTFTFPVVMAGVGLIRKAVTLILEFLPF